MHITTLASEHVEACLSVIGSLPQWFGYPGASDAIEDALRHQRGWVALDDEEVVGFVTVQELFQETLEITYLAVGAAHRHRGIGKSLLHSVRDTAAQQGFSSICLLTLGPSAGSEWYAETVSFYQAMGFWRTKELHLSTWGGAPALLMVVPLHSIR